MKVEKLGHGVAVAALLLTTVAVAAPAQADTAPVPPQPSAAFAGGVIEASGGAVTLKIVYTCTSFAGTLGNHLFVALKQGPTVTPENPSSGGGNVATFYSTNWQSDAGPNALSCDGVRHSQTVVLKPQPGFPATTSFSSGTALLQVCVYDNVTGFNNGEPVGGSSTPYTMESIRVGR